VVKVFGYIIFWEWKRSEAACSPILQKFADGESARFIAGSTPVTQPAQCVAAGDAHWGQILTLPVPQQTI
jgi:hypothetical protein